jgi:hypothetical protein
MPSYAEYFDRVCYKATWSIGDRVSGKWNKIPFVGTVGNDTLVNHEQGPRVTVHLDLPIKSNNEIKNIVIVKPKELKKLVNYETV